jgi:hypothetical protein
MEKPNTNGFENTNCIAPNSKMHFLNVLLRKLSNFSEWISMA